MLALLETRLQTDWQRQQQNSLNLTSPPHTEKSRLFWNRSRNQPGDWETMDMTRRKTRLTPLTEDPNHHLPSTYWSLWAKKTSKETTSCWFSPLWMWLWGANPEHILQTCPHLETVRQQFWPEDTEVGTKLWGQAAELQRTADFLAATGLRI